MGGSSSKKEKTTIAKEWEVTDRGDRFNLVRDNQGNQGQQYNHILDNRFDPTSELEIYQEREKTTLPLIRSLAAEHTVKGKGLVPENNFRVITESTPHTLTSLPQLTYPESLYVLDRSLEGYENLYHKSGPSRINSDMIGFTKQGQCKVWHNQNFGNNRPSHPVNILQSTGDRNAIVSSQIHGGPVSNDEADMVRNVVTVVGDKCMTGKWPGLNDNPPSAFDSRINGRIGFRQARSIIRQTAEEQRLLLPNKIDLYGNIVRTRSAPGIVTVNHGEFGQVIQSNMSQRVFSPAPAAYHPSYQAGRTSYKFIYHNPNQFDHPSIFASRIEIQ